VAPESDHRHCKVCGRVCDPEELTCSPECAERHTRALIQRRNLTYLLYGSIVLLAILLFSHYLV
jgi:predicted nucleic acid-binding Zn ribbon protein